MEDMQINGRAIRLVTPDEQALLEALYQHEDGGTLAKLLAGILDRLNHERQTIEEQVVAEAEAQIAERYRTGTARSLETARAIVVWNEAWHQGVVGIVASRLTRHYHRPSVVLTRDPSGQFTGSARSIRSLNLVQVLDECKDTLIRFGGHAMAAGLSLEDAIKKAADYPQLFK